MTRDQTREQVEEYDKLKSELIQRYGAYDAVLLEKEFVSQWRGDSVRELYDMAISAAKAKLSAPIMVGADEYDEIMRAEEIVNGA